MTHSVAAWHEEHAHFLRLLQLLQEQLDLFHGAERPNYELMLDVIRRLREFGDREHHPREDAAFERLVRYLPSLALRMQRLRQEHRVIAYAGERLVEFLDAILDGAMVPRADVELAAATYLVYYGSHIAREEEDVLPLAADWLTPADWQVVAAASPASLQQ